MSLYQQSVVIKKLLQKYDDLRSVSRSRLTDEHKDYIMMSILKFNSLAEDDYHIVDGYPVSEIFIPNELKDLIYPDSVRTSQRYRGNKDLLVRTDETMMNKGKDKVQEFTFNLSLWIEACEALRACYKTDFSSNKTNLADLKVKATLSDVLDRALSRDHTREMSMEDCFLPIPLTDEVDILFGGEMTRSWDEDNIPYIQARKKADIA